MYVFSIGEECRSTLALQAEYLIHGEFKHTDNLLRT